MDNRMTRLKGSEWRVKKMWLKCRLRRESRKKCPDANILAAYIDHSLSESEAQSLEAHLLQCGTCFDTVLAVRKAINKPVDGSLPDLELQRLFDLVSSRSGVWNRILDVLAGFGAPRVIPVPALVLSIILVCVLGFYSGMQTRFEQDTFRKTIAAELQFSFDVPVCGFEILAEGE
jgi:hypothetical protein